MFLIDIIERVPATGESIPQLDHLCPNVDILNIANRDDPAMAIRIPLLATNRLAAYRIGEGK